MNTTVILILRQLFVALAFLFASTACTWAQTHPRLLFGSTEGTALKARATREPYVSMLERIRTLTTKSGWSVDNTKAVDYATLFYFQGNNADAQKAAEASLHSIARGVIFDSSAKSISRGYELMHVALAYDLCANSSYYTNTIVPASFVSFIDGATYSVPSPYVGMTYKNAISLALKNAADLLVSSGGSEWPGDGSTGNNWFSLRYGGALLCYLASDTSYNTTNFNTALSKLRNYLRDTLGTTENARGWNPEGYGYNFFPARTTILTAIALKRSGGADLVSEYPALRYTSWSTLTGTLPIDFRFIDNWAGGTLDEMTRGIHPDVTDDNPQYIGEGVPYLALAMAYSQGGSQPDFDYRAGIRWIIDRTWGATANGGNNLWDFYRGAGLLGLLYYPDPEDSSTPASTNPAQVWGRTYFDPSYGVAIMRNRYQDAKDIVFQTSANERENYGGHYGMDVLAPRLIGLGVPWIVGPGRAIDARGESTLFPSDPEGYSSGTNGINPVGTRVHDAFLRTNGDGYLSLKSEVSDTGVESQSRRYLMDYSGVSGAAAVLVISDSSANGKWWRMQTLETNTITTSGKTFSITSPGGQVLKGTVISPSTVTFRTGTFARGSDWKTASGSVLNNKWIDFENTGTNGEFLVVLTLNESGTTPPTVTGTLSAPGQWSVSLPGRQFNGAGDVLTVSGWNRPNVQIQSPANNINYNAGATSVPLSGTASDTGGGVIKKIEVYLNGSLKTTSTHNGASISWNAVVPSVPLGEHMITVRAIDNDNDYRDAEINLKVNSTVPPQDVAISSPGSGDSFNPGDTLVLRGTGYDPENSLSRIEIWRDGVKLGNATVSTDSNTWSYSVPNLTTGLYEFEAIAFDGSGDYTNSGPLLVRCSQIFSPISTWGDSSQYYSSDGNTRFSPALTSAAVTSSPRWHVRSYEGDLRLHTWAGPTYDPFHSLTFRGPPPTDYRLRYKVKHLGTSAPGYNLSITPTLNLQMRTVNAVFDTRSWVGWLARGTCLWLSDPAGSSGYAGTILFDTSVNGGAYTSTSSHAGILGNVWTDVEVRKFGKNLVVKVRPTGQGTYTTIMDNTEYAIGNTGRLNINGRKLNDMGANTEAYFDDIELVELDSSGNPVVLNATSVNMLSPAPGSSVSGSVLQVAATITDSDGISSVEYFAGSRSLGLASLQSGQWKLTWQYPPTGIHSVYARVTDSQGNVFDSPANTVDMTSLGGPVTAVANGSPLSGIAPLPVTLSSSGSSSLQGSITSWSWNFGDGGTSTQANPSHTFSSPGIYTVNLTVTDSAGNQGYASIQVSAAYPAGSNPVLIEDDFSTNSSSAWDFLSASTLSTAPTEFYSSSGGSGNFLGSGVLTSKAGHSATSSTQSTLQFQPFGAVRDISTATLSTTGIHSDKGNVYLAVRYFDSGSLKWAVSSQSIRTTYGSKSGGWTPVPGSWSLSGMTWKALDLANLNAGGGASIDTSTVLVNADAAGFYSVATGIWMSAGLGIVDSYLLANSVTAVAPAITSQPVAVSVLQGASASFTVAATGVPPPSYQWRKNGINLAGQSSSTLTIGSVSLADAGNYSVVVSNSEGSVTSNSAALIVNSPPTNSLSESFTDSSSVAPWDFIGSNSLGSNPPTKLWRQSGVSSLNWTGGSLGSLAWNSATSSTQATLNFRVLASTSNITNSIFSTDGIHAGSSTAKFAVRYVEGGLTKWAVSSNSIRTTTGYNASGWTPVPGTWALSSFTWKSVDAANLSAGEGATVNSAAVLQNATAVGVYGLQTGTWLGVKFPQIVSFNLTGVQGAGSEPPSGPPLAFTTETSSWIGGPGTNAGVTGTVIQADGTILLAANLENATLPSAPVTLLGSATSASQGAIIKLSSDGRTLLGVTRIGAAVYDLASDASGAIYVAAGTDGLLKLNAAASQLIWTRRAGQFVYRVDAGTDGYAACLIPSVTTAERDNKAGAGTIVVINPTGTEVSSFAGSGNTLDVAVDSATSTVVYCGWYNFFTYTGTYSRSYNGGTTTPVDVPYFHGVPYNYGQSGIARKWVGHNWELNPWTDQAARIANPRWINAPFSTSASNLYTQAEIDALESSEGRADGYYQYLLNNPKTLSNNMADSRAYRCTVGRDGFLYVGYEAAGGNTPLRSKNSDLSAPVTWVEADGFFDKFYNTSTVFKLVIGRYELSQSSAAEELVFGFTNRVTDPLRSSTDNTIFMRGGSLTSDEDGRIYVGGGCYSGFYLPGNTLPSFDIPRQGEIAFDPFDPSGTLGEYTGGSYIMVMNNTATKRLYSARIGGGGVLAIDARAVGANPVTRLAFGGLVDDTISVMGDSRPETNKLYTYQAMQSSRTSGSTSDGFFSVVAVTDPDTQIPPVAPSITDQPASMSVNAGETVSFAVTATGSPTPTYQWRKNGVNLAGETASTLSIASAASGDAGSYSVVVTNSAGTVTSQQAVLTVNSAQPLSVDDEFGSSTTAATWDFLGSNSLGSNPPTELWRQNGVSSFGWTGGALGSQAWHSSTSSIQASLNYREIPAGTNLSDIVFTTAGIHTGSSTAKFAVRYVEGGLTKWAVSSNSIRTTTGYSASGWTPVPGTWALSSFTWKSINPADLSAGEGSTVSAAVVLQNASAVGVYGLLSGTWIRDKFPQIVSFTLTNPTSSAAPTISQQPSSLTVDENTTAAFSVVASGTPAPTYQWRKDGVPLTGQTSAALTLNLVTMDDAGSYTVEITNSAGSVVSSAAVLTVQSTALANDLTSANLAGSNMGAVSGSSRILLNGKWELNGLGGSLGGTSDAARVETRTMSGSFEMSVRMNSVVSAGSDPRAGLMVRASASAGAIAAWISVAPGGALQIGSRTTVDGVPTLTYPSGALIYPNAWLGLSRIGNDIVFYSSGNGIDWTELASVRLEGLGASTQAGLYVSSGSSGVSVRAIADEFALVPLQLGTVFSDEFVTNSTLAQWQFSYLDSAGGTCSREWLATGKSPFNTSASAAPGVLRGKLNHISASSTQATMFWKVIEETDLRGAQAGTTGIHLARPTTAGSGFIVKFMDGTTEKFAISDQTAHTTTGTTSVSAVPLSQALNDLTWRELNTATLNSPRSGNVLSPSTVLSRAIGFGVYGQASGTWLADRGLQIDSLKLEALTP